MTTIKEYNPEKEYKAEYLKDYKEPTYEFDKIPWVNAPQIQSNVSLDE